MITMALCSTYALERWIALFIGHRRCSGRWRSECFLTTAASLVALVPSLDGLPFSSWSSLSIYGHTSTRGMLKLAACYPSFINYSCDMVVLQGIHKRQPSSSHGFIRQQVPFSRLALYLLWSSWFDVANHCILDDGGHIKRPRKAGLHDRFLYVPFFLTTFREQVSDFLNIQTSHCSRLARLVSGVQTVLKYRTLLVLKAKFYRRFSSLYWCFH